MNKPTEARISKLLDELPPADGDASNLSRELTRAISQLNHRFYDYGDRLGVGRGMQTCNSAGMFIASETTSAISNKIREVWISPDAHTYEQRLERVTKLVLDYIERHPELSHRRYYALWEDTPRFSNLHNDHR